MPTEPGRDPFAPGPPRSAPGFVGPPSHPGMSLGGSGPVAFAITGPPTLAISNGRGTTQFTITNLTGRPVRARLLPRALQGADQSWIQLPGPHEIPLGVGATSTVDVAVVAPPDAPAGSYLVQLDAVPEDDTEAHVPGPAATFTLPPPTPPNSRRWLLPLIIGTIVLVLAGGTGIFLLTRPRAPQNTEAPLISGSEPAPVGAELTATSGQWKAAGRTDVQWQRCVAASCVDIEGVTGLSYTVADADLGQSLIVVVTAWQQADGTGLSTRVQSPSFAVAARPTTPTFTPRFPARSSYGPDATYRADVIRVAQEGGLIVVSIDASGKTDLRAPQTSCVQVQDDSGTQIAALPVKSWEPTLSQPDHYQGDLAFDPGTIPVGTYLFRYSCAADYTPARIGTATQR